MANGGSATNEHEEPTSELDRASSARLRLGILVANSYRLVRQIGSGGSSHVFEAEHVRLGKHFALKLLRPELDPSRRTAQRFRREARAVARLQSEHIVSVVDCGELEEGTPYLVMELLEGEDLRALLNREGSLPVRRALPLIIEACRGLTAVHGAGLVHRDLKPENLFITRRSSGEDWCKVLDFGVAKMESSLSTAENAIIGAAVGPATDVYALGAIFYECLTGEAAVSGSTVQEVMYRIMNAEPVALSRLAPSVPREIASVIESCLHKSPQARPASTAKLAELLQLAAKAPSPSASIDATLADDAARPPPTRQRRYANSLALGGALAIALGSACVGWFAHVASSPRESVQPQSLARTAAVAHEPASQLGTAIANQALPPMSAATADPRPSQPVPHASAAKLVPRPARPAGPVPQARPANGFDSANPYE
jgi:serine/threonine-protein kinase